MGVTSDTNCIPLCHISFILHVLVIRGSLKLDIVIQILTHTWWELLLMKSVLFGSERFMMESHYNSCCNMM